MAEYMLVKNTDEIKKYIGSSKVLSFDFETAPTEKYRNEQYAALDPHKSEIVGISFSVTPGTGIYLPIRHKEPFQNATLSDEMVSFLRDIFLSNNIVKIAHNLAFEAMFLYAIGIKISTPVYDTIAAAQLTLKSNTEFRNLSDSGLKTLVPELLCVELPKFEDVTGGRCFDELDPMDKETIRYACADSDFALQLYYLFNNWFDRYLPKHRWIVENIESSTAVFTGIMKYCILKKKIFILWTAKVNC